MDVKRNEVYLAALLHDIGKFYQRADSGSTKDSVYLSEEIKKLETLYCPHYKEKYSHKHVLWTAQFFKDFSTTFSWASGENKVSSDLLMRYASSHHNPSGNDIIEKIIQKADHYSSGADRSVMDSIGWKDAEEESKWDSFKKVRMRSIFEGVSLRHDAGEVWSAEYKKRLPLTKIQFNSDEFFPSDSETDNADYLKLWEGFISEVDKVRESSLKVFCETMLFLLEKYTSLIPSSTLHLPDVSLYDHMKTSAAFAICLYDYMSEKKMDVIPDASKKPFLLLGGDLSGIQKFIYGIIARGAAKNLKGRSFYLHLLVDNVVQALIMELGLYSSNIIYSSGGKFYILAPNTEENLKKIQDFEQKMSEKLFEFHKAELSMYISTVAFGEEEIFYNKGSKSNTIGHVWNELAEQLTIKKNQSFIHQVSTSYETLFEPHVVNGDERKDAITGEEISGKAVDLDGHLVDQYTFEMIELGTRLRDVDYWVFSTEELSYFPSKSFSPIGMHWYNYFVPKKFFENGETMDKLRKSADRIRAISINDLGFLDTPQKGIDNIYGFCFYGGNKFPVSNHYKSPKVFEELAGVEFSDVERSVRKHSPALVRIGVLRMDVDNLGALFHRGFSPDKRSFSRYSNLSRSLDYFFKGYLNEIWRREEYREFTQIIYSGGDDLFLVGKWEVLIEMAKDINLAFKEWTCDTHDLSISGGIAIVPPKFPLLKAAKNSESEEKNAKKHCYGTAEKNAFSLFGYAFNWGTEFPYLLQLKEELKDLLDSNRLGGLASGFPSSIYNLMNQAGFVLDKVTGQYKIQNYQVVWLIAYSLKRNSSGKSPHIQEFFKAWTEKIFTGKISEIEGSQYHSLQILAIAARWASLELR